MNLSQTLLFAKYMKKPGLTIQSPQLCGIKDWTESDGSRYMVLVFFYKTDKFKGELKSSDEGKVFGFLWTHC